MSSSNNGEGGDPPSRNRPPSIWIPTMEIDPPSSKQSSHPLAPKPQPGQYPRTSTTSGGLSASRAAQPEWRRIMGEPPAAQVTQISRTKPVDEPPTPRTTRPGSEPEWRLTMGAPSTARVAKAPRTTRRSRPPTAHAAQPATPTTTDQPPTPQTAQPEWRQTMSRPPVAQVIHALETVTINEPSTPKTAQPEWRQTMGGPSTPRATRPWTVHDVQPKTPTTSVGSLETQEDQPYWRRAMGPLVTPPRATKPSTEELSPASSCVTVTSLSSTKTVTNTRWENTPKTIMEKNNWRSDMKLEKSAEDDYEPIVEWKTLAIRPDLSKDQKKCEDVCYEAAVANGWKVISIRCATHKGSTQGTKSTLAPDEYRLTVYVGDQVGLGEDVAKGKGHIYVTKENGKLRIRSRAYMRALGVSQNPEIFDPSGHFLFETVGPE